MKTALVWGAGGGIGRALVAELMKSEWNIIAMVRKESSLKDAAATIIEADVADEYAIQHAVIQASQVTEEVGLWIFSIGDILASPIDELDNRNWKKILDANLNGAFLSFHYSQPLLQENAHLMFLGAKSERLQLPGLSAYAAAKSGLEAFATVLRKEQRKKKISLIRPAAVATAFWEKVPFRMPSNAQTPAEIAAAVLQAYQDGHSGVLDLP